MTLARSRLRWRSSRSECHDYIRAAASGNNGGSHLQSTRIHAQSKRATRPELAGALYFAATRGDVTVSLLAATTGS